MQYYNSISQISHTRFVKAYSVGHTFLFMVMGGGWGEGGEGGGGGEPIMVKRFSWWGGAKKMILKVPLTKKQLIKPPACPAAKLGTSLSGLELCVEKGG